jgi:hypothetical protein
MSKTRFDILASAAQTATAQGGGISVSGIKAMALCVDVTSVSGSVTVYAQSSSDGGTTWFDLLAESVIHLTSGVAGGTTGTWLRNVTPANLGTGNISKCLATYRAFGDYIRAAWVISGSGASSTFSVKGIGEN